MVNPESVGGVKMDAEIETGKFDQGMKKLDQGMKKLDPSMKRTEKGMKDVEKAGDQAAKATGRLDLSFKKLLPSLTAANLASVAIIRTLRGVKDTFVGAVRGAIDFEAQLVQVRKVTGATALEMSDLKKFIKELSVETGIAKEALADIAAGGGRLGIFAREGPSGLQKFTEVIAKSRIAMEDYALSSEEATDKTARLLNLFGLKSDDAEVLLSIMNELSNTAAATSSNIADNVVSFASLSQSFGASKESLLALATTMEEVGSEPQAFSTALQRALFEMQANTEKFASFLGADLGPKFKETFAEEPIEAFAIFLQGLKQTGRDIGSTLESLGIGDARLTRELAKLATDKGLERFSENLKNATDSSVVAQDAVNGLTGAASSLQEEFDRASDTTRKRLSSMGEQATNVGQAFGEGLLPNLNRVIDGLTVGLAGAIPVAQRVGEMLGGLIGIVASLANQIDRMVSKLPAGTIKAALSARFPVASRLLFSSPTKDDGVLIGRLGSTGGATGGTTPPEEFSVDAGGLGAEGRAEAASKIEKAEEAILKAIGEQAKANVENLKLRRDELKLRKEMGVLTVDERRELDRINHRIEFQKDAIDDATKAWRDQVQELERIEDRIEDINRKIREEQESLQQSLRDIEKDTVKKQADTLLGLLKEKQQLEDNLKFRRGLSEEDQERIREIDKTLERAQFGDLQSRARKNALLGEKAQFEEIQNPRLHGGGRDLSETEQRRLAAINSELTKLKGAEPLSEAFSRAKELSELDPLEQIKALEKEQLAAAKEKSQMRIDELNAELAAERKKRDTVSAFEAEKKQIVIDALNSRREQTILNYELLEERTALHVEKQIAQFRKLKATLSAIASASASSTSSLESSVANSLAPGFAGGGRIFGPGSGTGDQVLLRGSPGEFMVNARAYAANKSLVEAINSGVKLPKFAQGGAITNDNSRRINVTQTFNQAQMSNPHLHAWMVKRSIG